MTNKLDTLPATYLQSSPGFNKNPGPGDLSLRDSAASPSHIFNPQYEGHGSGECPSADPIQQISQLPDELLACIFGHVLRAQLCPAGRSFHSDTEWYSFMGYPILFSHVCSSWRQIAINSPALWSRVYICPGLFDHPRYIALLEAYLNRSGQTPLKIFILDLHQPGFPDISGSMNCDSDMFLTFLGSVVPRAKHLILKSERGLFSGGHPRSTLMTCLDKCTPGMLENFTVDIAIHGYPASQSPDMSLDLPRLKFEQLWPSVPVLRLKGYYPYAINTSKLVTKHGFTELRLGGYHPITEPTLIDILTASPQLRVLEVSMDIIGSLSKGPSIEPILLENLEIVKSVTTHLPSTHQRQLRILLRLLQPGPKPLILCISNPNQGSDTEFVCQAEVQAFLGRSNIQQLCVHGLERRSHLLELLKLVPSVQTLASPDLKYLGSGLHIRIPGSQHCLDVRL